MIECISEFGQRTHVSRDARGLPRTMVPTGTIRPLMDRLPGFVRQVLSPRRLGVKHGRNRSDSVRQYEGDAIADPLYALVDRRHHVD
jgi:hypothetical protein